MRKGSFSDSRLIKTKALVLFFPLLFCVFLSTYVLVKYISFNPNEINFTTLSSKIYDRNKNFLWEISENNSIRNTPVSINEVPLDCRNAIIAIEDRTFYSNTGIDSNGIVRLGLSLFTNGSFGGGSTITQQVVKNAYQNIYNRDPLDKLNEMILAVKITHYRPKNEILEMYLNNVYFGNLNYGIESASQDYFKKSSRDLNLAECSYMMGITQWPGVYNPHGRLELGLNRQKTVLKAMLRDGYIDQEEFNEAVNFELSFNYQGHEIRAPHYVQFIQNEFQDIIKNKSLEIYTSYDYELHKTILELLQNKVIDTSFTNVNNAAVVILEDNNLASMVGSVDFFNNNIDGQFNSTTGARELGSLWKPILSNIEQDTNFTVDTLNELNQNIFTLRKANNTDQNNTSLNKNKENLNEILQANNINLGECDLDNIIEECKLSLFEAVVLYRSIITSDNLNLKLVGTIRNLTENEVIYQFQENSTNKATEPRIKLFKPTKEFKILLGETINNKDTIAIAFNEKYTIGVWVGNTRGEELNGLKSSDLAEPIILEIISKLIENQLNY